MPRKKSRSTAVYKAASAWKRSAGASANCSRRRAGWGGVLGDAGELAESSELGGGTVFLERVTVGGSRS